MFGAVSAPPNGRSEVQIVLYHRCVVLREDTPGVVYIELLRRLGPRDEVEPLDGRSPQYQPVFMIDTRPLRKKIRRSPTYGMSAASCRPRRLERNHTPNAGRVPDDDAAIRRFKGLPIFFSFIRYVRSARFAVPLSTNSARALHVQ